MFYFPYEAIFKRFLNVKGISFHIFIPILEIDESLEL